MSSTASQVAIAEANHTLPTRQSAYQGGSLHDRFISAFRHIKETAVARPAIPQGGYLFDVSDPSILAALSGSLSGPRRAEHALNAVADSWKQTPGRDATSVGIYAWHIANGMLMIGNASVGKVARSGHPA